MDIAGRISIQERCGGVDSVFSASIPHTFWLRLGKVYLPLKYLLAVTINCLYLTFQSLHIFLEFSFVHSPQVTPPMLAGLLLLMS